ncbi:UDP-glucose 4-epimerase GalE [Brevibacillus sp. B_LB10_24]|uniref:UDP-glucose 4-epimerase GalE n=1 Tax=Brevibacillus sp. B_LB10_24 TaxID=3380645 RepID=UPI0038B7EFD3
MILVVGGAGYVGSHTVRMLLDQGYQVAVLDNLTTGHRAAVDPRTVFIDGDLGDCADLDRVFSTYPITGVMHFAANSLVAESVANPLKYYQNNVASTINLLESMLRYGVRRFIFSSTAAVYGVPDVELIDETLPANPINPYGRTKRMIEQIIEDLSVSHGLEYVTLRYFNAAGAHLSGEIGEDHDQESHLIPIVLQHLLGLRDKITVFGTDYDTPDGTCIRDYIHVLDLANAHILALAKLFFGEVRNQVYNLGTGRGYSVKEVISLCEETTGRKAVIQLGNRREGDPPRLVAANRKVKAELNWVPEHDLKSMISSAWNWHTKYPAGYQVLR